MSMLLHVRGSLGRIFNLASATALLKDKVRVCYCDGYRHCFEYLVQFSPTSTDPLVKRGKECFSNFPSDREWKSLIEGDE